MLRRAAEAAHKSLTDFKRFGFVPSPLREQQWLLLLKDARRLLAGE